MNIQSTINKINFNTQHGDDNYDIILKIKFITCEDLEIQYGSDDFIFFFVDGIDSLI